VLFLIATFLSPLVSVVPYEAATPALVIVGFLMMQQVRGISWDDLEIAIPAFLTIVLMPFTYSITVGIGAGLVVYTLIKVVRGKSAAVHPLLWVVSALFVLYFAIEPVKQVLGVSSPDFSGHRRATPRSGWSRCAPPRPSSDPLALRTAAAGGSLTAPGHGNGGEGNDHGGLRGLRQRLPVELRSARSGERAHVRLVRVRHPQDGTGV
jgi:hypothetical protein